MRSIRPLLLCLYPANRLCVRGFGWWMCCSNSCKSPFVVRPARCMSALSYLTMLRREVCKRGSVPQAQPLTPRSLPAHAMRSFEQLVGVGSHIIMLAVLSCSPFQVPSPAETKWCRRLCFYRQRTWPLRFACGSSNSSWPHLRSKQSVIRF